MKDHVGLTHKLANVLDPLMDRAREELTRETGSRLQFPRERRNRIRV